MRLLRGDLLRIHCRAPLHEVSAIDLRRFGIESLNPSLESQDDKTKVTIVVNTSEDREEDEIKEVAVPTTPLLVANTTTRTWEYKGDPLGQCSILQVLLLSENRLTSLAGIECCQGRLWKLDVRDNMINDLSAFISMEHLGELDLGGNAITYNELVKLSHMHIMSIRLDGNPSLVGSDGKQDKEYRRNVLHLLPNIWMLDDCIVTAKERRSASDFFDSFGNDVSDEVPENIRNILSLAKRIGVPRTNTKGGDGVAGGGEPSPPEKNDETCGPQLKSVFAWGSSQFMLPTLNDDTNIISVSKNEPTPSSSTSTTTSSSKLPLSKSTGSSKPKIYPNDIAQEVHLWAASKPLPEHSIVCQTFQQLLLRQPFLPELQDKFRMSHIIKFHNYISNIHSTFFDLNAPKVGTAIIDPGKFDLLQLQHLSPRMRLDLCILMCISIEFDVPHFILQDSLSILLKLDLSDQNINNISNLPKYCRSLLCRALHDIGKTEVSSGLLTGKEFAIAYTYTELELELLRSIPKFVTKPCSMNYDEGDNDSRTSLELRARHGIILLSRSPSFPPLLQSKQLGNAGVQATYSRLLPLLMTGGMAAPDLADESGGENLWRLAVSKPSRNYSRPWAGDDANKDDVNEDDVNEDGTSAPKLIDDSIDLPTSLAELRQSRTRSRLYEGSFFEASSLILTKPAPNILFEDEPSASAAYYASSRLPKVGERVEIAYEQGQSYFPLIVDITDEANAVQLEPLINVMGNRTSGGGNSMKVSEKENAATSNVWLGIRELIWNPNFGYWRHSSAMAMAAKKMKAISKANSYKLYRSSSSLSKSGVSGNYGVNNVAITDTKRINIDNNIDNNSNSRKNEPKAVGGFSANGTWDSQFVLAPPVLIEAQNNNAQRNSWQQVEHPEFSMNAGPNMNYQLVEKADTLGAPAPSAVYTLLQEQLTYNEALNSKSMPKEPSNDDSNTSSLFDLTSLPNEPISPTTASSTKKAGPEDNSTTAEQKMEENKRPITPTSAALERDIRSRTKVLSRESSKSGGGGGGSRKRNDGSIKYHKPAATKHEMTLLTAARVNKKKKKAAGATAWFIQQPKATLVVDELSYQHAMARKQREKMLLNNQDKEQTEKNIFFKEDERSRLVRKVALLRRRASRTKFSTMKGYVDETLNDVREKGRIARDVVRVAPHNFVPKEDAVPTPLLPNISLSSGIYALARRQRVNKWKRSSTEMTRSENLIISASAPALVRSTS